MPHYHITVVSSQFSLKPVTLTNVIDALSEYGRVVKLVQDQTGLVPVSNQAKHPTAPWISSTTNFLDGSTVKLHECQIYGHV